MRSTLIIIVLLWCALVAVLVSGCTLHRYCDAYEGAKPHARCTQWSWTWHARPADAHRDESQNRPRT
jgi:hypothetical protein